MWRAGQIVVLVSVVFGSVPLVMAHPGEPLAPHDLWTAWNIGLFPLLPLTIWLLTYVWGVQIVWRRVGVGHGISLNRCAAFFVAIFALLVALISPLDSLSGVLFSAHMVQHLLLMVVAAPLLILSEFPLVMLRVLPLRWSRLVGHRWNRAAHLHRLWHVLTLPLAVWLAFGGMMWLWHAPSLYQAALQDEHVHLVEHVGFLGSATLFWWAILNHSRPKTSRYIIAAVLLFTTALHSGILGALMTFTESPWYPFYAHTVALWGLTPLQDQQLAGVIMWVPAGLVFTFLSILYFGAFLRAVDPERLNPVTDGVETHD